ncbi:response regulator transcription factor [Pseudalkalibacillus sp. R45]|uniref:response regulator transcription factor n=1 Tax=Pseudalkalibacillus sp. R45 TaxID=3457433 RepID=UPI003FCC64E6
MIVDDEPLEREVLTMIIKRENLGISELFEATNGADALDLAKNKRIDVVLMDVKMPIMDGLVAAEKIKKDVPECNVILLTAYDKSDPVYKTINSGTHDYLLKPAHPSEVKQALKKYIPEVKRSFSSSLKAPCEHEDILTLIEYIENNLYLDLNLDTLSSLVHLSGQYLSRLFKQETGYTITQYITICRLEKAKKCLYSRENIMEVSEKCGFSDPNYFARVFKKYEGVTPTQYQQQSFIGRKKRINSFNNFIM